MEDGSVAVFISQEWKGAVVNTATEQTQVSVCTIQSTCNKLSMSASEPSICEERGETWCFLAKAASRNRARAGTRIHDPRVNPFTCSPHSHVSLAAKTVSGGGERSREQQEVGNWRQDLVGCLIPECFHLLLMLSSSSTSFSSFLLPFSLSHPCLQISMK